MDVFMRVLIVIPAYNEEASICGVVEKVTAAGYDYVVINDGSKDGTARVCAEHGINVVNLPQNLGIGGAVQTGHIYARDHGYDVDIQVDGDGQHDISYASRLLERIEAGDDLVVGSRFVDGGKESEFKSTAIRRLGINWLKMCIRLVTGITIYDATSGFRASGRRSIELFANNYPSDYPEPEAIVVAHNHGLRISEVPVAMHERQGGVTSISPLKSVYYMIKVTLAIVLEGMAKRG